MPHDVTSFMDGPRFKISKVARFYVGTVVTQSLIPFPLRYDFIYGCSLINGLSFLRFYEQLLRLQILNVQKKQSSWQCCLALLGPTSVKAARKTLVKLIHGVNFINVLRAAFCTSRSQKHKKILTI